MLETYKDKINATKDGSLCWNDIIIAVAGQNAYAAPMIVGCDTEKALARIKLGDIWQPNNNLLIITQLLTRQRNFTKDDRQNL